MDVIIEVLIDPKAASRPRARGIMRRGKPSAVVYTDAATLKWQGQFAKAVAPHVSQECFDLHTELTKLNKSKKADTVAAVIVSEQLAALQIQEDLRLDVVAVIQRPQRLMRRADPDGLIFAPVKPDRDNIDKNVMDALRPFIRDDGQIVMGSLVKCYTEKAGAPRVMIRLRSAALFAPEQIVKHALGFPTY